MRQTDRRAGREAYRVDSRMLSKNSLFPVPGWDRPNKDRAASCTERICDHLSSISNQRRPSCMSGHHAGPSGSLRLSFHIFIPSSSLSQSLFCFQSTVYKILLS